MTFRDIGPSRAQHAESQNVNSVPDAARNIEISRPDLIRAARLLAVRSRRQTAGFFAGSYASAFRGSGIEFEESRPYVPGDDVRTIDWNATARRGEPYVKRFREERDQTLLLALDVSASMRFGSSGGGKAGTAVHAAALLAVAAGLARDRVGLLVFDDAVRASIPPARGEAHIWQLIRTALEAAERSGGSTRLAAALDGVQACLRRRAVVLLLSDFRDDRMVDGGAFVGALRAKLVALARHHEVVAAVLHDPRDEALPRVGGLRLTDPERPGGVLMLDSGSARARARYRDACERRRKKLELALRSAGADVLFLRTDRDPLGALAQFFRVRAGRYRVAS